MMEDPVLQLKPILHGPIFYPLPILTTLQRSRLNANYAAIMVGSCLFARELLYRGLTTHAMFWLLVTFAAACVSCFLLHSSLAIDLFKQYDNVLLATSVFIYLCAAAAAYGSRFDSDLVTTVFTLLPCYNFPQYYKTVSGPIFFLMTSLMALPFASHDGVSWVVVICECAFLQAAACNTDDLLTMALEADQKIKRGETLALGESKEVQKMQLKLRGLLERSFDGFVQVEDGLVKWANDKFWALFPDLSIGCKLLDAFVPHAHKDVNKACTGEEVGWLYTVMGFPCKLIATPGPTASDGASAKITIIAGIQKKAEPDSDGKGKVFAGIPSEIDDWVELWIDIGTFAVTSCSYAFQAVCGHSMIGVSIINYVQNPDQFMQELAVAVEKAQLTYDAHIPLGQFSFGSRRVSSSTVSGRLFLSTASMFDDNTNSIKLWMQYESKKMNTSARLSSQ